MTIMCLHSTKKGVMVEYNESDETLHRYTVCGSTYLNIRVLVAHSPSKVPHLNRNVLVVYSLGGSTWGELPQTVRVSIDFI